MCITAPAVCSKPACLNRQGRQARSARCACLTSLAHSVRSMHGHTRPRAPLKADESTAKRGSKVPRESLESRQPMLDIRCHRLPHLSSRPSASLAATRRPTKRRAMNEGGDHSRRLAEIQVWCVLRVFWVQTRCAAERKKGSSALPPRSPASPRITACHSRRPRAGGVRVGRGAELVCVC